MNANSRWNERCPSCDFKIDVHSYFVSHDYSTDFQIDCPICDKPIQVDVHPVPEFELSKVK